MIPGYKSLTVLETFYTFWALGLDCYRHKNVWLENRFGFPKYLLLNDDITSRSCLIHIIFIVIKFI